MAAPSFSSLYKISVRRADGGIIFRPKSHNIVSQSVKNNLQKFAANMKGNKIASNCKGKKFKAFRGCLRSEGAAAYRS
jgi:hypothetical protein|tara:strand:+ start:1909 stop:2142 length:234 start_codon:yes stop_codon:yes gene_type:complete